MFLYDQSQVQKFKAAQFFLIISLEKINIFTDYAKIDQNIFSKQNIIKQNLKMSYFYSEPLTYCECIMPRQTAWESMNQMGELQIIHIQQKQVDYSSPYIKILKRCEQAIIKITDIRKFVEDIKLKLNVNINLNANHERNRDKKHTYKQIIRIFNRAIEKQKIHGYLYFNQIEDEIRTLHQHLWGQKKELQKIQSDMQTKIQSYALMKTLMNCSQFKTIVKQMKIGEGGRGIFQYRCAMIQKKQQVVLQRAVFRISRGHCWLKFFQMQPQRLQIPMKYHSAIVSKVACIFMFESGEQGSLLAKIVRLLTAFETTQIPSSVSPQKFQQHCKVLHAQIKQLQNIEQLSCEAIERYLHRMMQQYEGGEIPMLQYLEVYSKKQKQIYTKLASMTEAGSFLRFNIFIPTQKLATPLPHITLTPKQNSPKKPSLFSTNKMLQIPQQILNTYGIPSYGQFNPSPLYIVTFAFFIGVMFGDIGHMLMMLPYLIWAKVNGKDNLWAWVVVFFIAYCGLIYGEFCGLKIALFDSCYHYSVMTDGQQRKSFQSSNCVYPIGLDPIWSISTNNLQFVNSFKMKLAVILGVLHMLVGLGLRLLNNIKSKKYLALFTLAIPQVMFMVCTFLYMDFLIVKKWMTQYVGDNTAKAPSIIGTMIQVFAGFGDKQPLFWEGQTSFETFLKISAYSMIPIMLVGVPFGTYIKGKNIHKKIKKQSADKEFHNLVDEKIEADVQSRNSSQEVMSDRDRNIFPQEHSDHSEDFSQVIVHSFIETIEYLLSTISNTASYLRLWALSLAHSQLSQVLFTLILEPSLAGGYSRIILAFFAFIAFYTATFGVLVCMDSMECFLHALRLHWVEFQSKFYDGKGYKFQAFGFKQILK